MDWNQLEIEAYAYLNLTPHELYEFTPQEYANLLQGYQIKRELELKDKQYQAWFIANFVGAAFNGTELPTLESIMTLTNNKTKSINSNKKFIDLAIKMGLNVPQEIIEGILKD